jgi:capsular polysaccharide biosynthesis protein
VLFKDYWRILRRRGWIIVLLTIIGLVGMLGVGLLQTPKYRSTIRLFVVPARPDYNLFLAGKNMLSQIALEVRNPSLAEKVVEQLLGRARSSVEEDKYIINLSVDDPDPQTAQAIASAWGQLFVEDYAAKNADLDRRDRLDVLTPDPAWPAAPSGLKTWQLALVGLLGGVLLGLLAALALEFLDDTLKTTEDVERFVGLPTLGAIPARTGNQ